MPAFLDSRTAIADGGLNGPIHTPAIELSSGAIDLSLGSYYTKLIQVDTAFTLSGVTPTSIFTLAFDYDAGLITWFSGIKWPNNVTPTLYSGVSYVFTFTSTDNGATWLVAAGISQQPIISSIIRSGGGSNNGDTVSGTLFSGDEGYFVLVVDLPYNSSSASAITPAATPAGWTLLASYAPDSGSIQTAHFIYGRIITSLATPDFTTVYTSSRKQYSRFRRADGLPLVALPTLVGLVTATGGTGAPANITINTAGQSTNVNALVTCYHAAASSTTTPTATPAFQHVQSTPAGAYSGFTIYNRFSTPSNHTVSLLDGGNATTHIGYTLIF